MSQQKTHYNTELSSHDFSIIICCNGISSPANIGSIFRLADAFGVEKILFDTEEVDISSARLRRTARSTEKNVPFQATIDLYPNITELKKEGYEVIAIEITDTSISLSKTLLSNQKLVLLLGNESFGVSQSLLELCDQHLHIDMFGLNSSMNVAQATGIALYEVTKQLKQDKR